jgi:uncharacterized protein (DUF1684 family)
MSDAIIEDEAAYVAELERHRAAKDDYLATDHHSPIPAAERDEFTGLSYYEPDPAYRVAATVEPIAGEDTFEMEMTAGQPRTYRRVARLAFDLNGEARSLYAYEQVGSHAHGSLFVPFRDETSGEETYGAGRYMEFEVEGDLAEVEAVPLDFNLAYFPFCAYNEAFACPITPLENRLATRVEAGERF